eukprot:m.920305 g.920305  ORF g.920305 m.920305 type:complete len:96 (-) comp23754_c0_seq35:4059-4346(-)
MLWKLLTSRSFDGGVWVSLAGGNAELTVEDLLADLGSMDVRKVVQKQRTEVSLWYRYDDHVWAVCIAQLQPWSRCPPAHHRLVRLGVNYARRFRM